MESLACRLISREAAGHCVAKKSAEDFVHCAWHANGKTALQGILSCSLATQAEAELAARAEAQAEARFSANELLEPKSQGLA